VRKASNHQPLDHDQYKLRGLTDPHLWFAYWIGVLLTLSRRGVGDVEVYVGGVVDRPMTALLLERLKEAGIAVG